MTYAILVLLGLAAGSFVNALVWRLRMQDQLRNRDSRPDRESSKKIDSRVKPKNDNVVAKYSIVNGRSMCPSCKHQLVWYDLIPVFSWLSLKGKCRYCNKSISVRYPIVEILTSLIFIISGLHWPYELGTTLQMVVFCLWLVIATLLIALSSYDQKWMELPTNLVYLVGILTLAMVSVQYSVTGQASVITSSVIGSLGLGGFFWLLYQLSNGKWIGGGDVRLGFVLGLLMGWQKAIVAVTLAAYIGTVIVVVLALMGKYKKHLKLPFGPLLIAGAFIGMLCGQEIIDWYLRLIGL